MKIKISKRATHARNELMLLQNVFARMWQNLVAFSSVVNRQDFNSGSYMRSAAAVPGLDRAAVAGTNGLKVQYQLDFSLLLFQIHFAKNFNV